MVTREPDLVSVSVSVGVRDRVRVRVRVRVSVRARVRARVSYVHARAGHEGLPEHVDALRLDADDLDRRVELLDSGGDAGEKRAAAHGEEDGVERRARRRPLLACGDDGRVLP